MVSFQNIVIKHSNNKIKINTFVNSLQISNDVSNLHPILNCTDERAPSFSSKYRGSLTVETAMVLPLYVLGISCLLFFMHVMCVQLQVEQRVHSAGKKLAVESYLHFFHSVEREVEKELDKLAYCSRRQYFFSSVGGSDEVVDIVVYYQIELPFFLPGVKHIDMVQRGRLKAWTGYVDNNPAGENERFVYVAETGTVYHLSHQCTYLQLSIDTISSAQIAGSRNEQGGKYYPCERCVRRDGPGGTVFIARTGDRYHNRISCSGLKRRVTVLPISETGGKSACSRCGKAG